MQGDVVLFEFNEISQYNETRVNQSGKSGAFGLTSIMLSMVMHTARSRTCHLLTHISAKTAPAYLSSHTQSWELSDSSWRTPTDMPGSNGMSVCALMKNITSFAQMDCFTGLTAVIYLWMMCYLLYLLYEYFMQYLSTSILWSARLSIKHGIAK